MDFVFRKYKSYNKNKTRIPLGNGLFDWRILYYIRSTTFTCADIRCRCSISLQQEAQNLTNLKVSPYVVQFFGVDASVPIFNLFFENASGGTLYDLIINSKRGMIRMSEMEVGFYAINS